MKLKSYRSRGAQLAFVALSVGVLVTLLVAPVAADGTEAASSVAEEDTDAILSDLGGQSGAAEAYVELYGVSPKEAVRRLNRIDTLRPIISRIQEIEGDRLAGSGTIHEPMFTGWVLLAGNAPPSPATLELVASVDELRVDTGAEFTLAELLAEVDAGPLSQRMSDPALSEITSVGIDMRANKIVVGIELSADSGAGSPEADERAPELETLLNDVARNAYRVEERPKFTTSASFKGGEAVEWFDGVGGDLCTSGFAVHRNGTRGFLTAGHCRTPGIFPVVQYAVPLFAGVNHVTSPKSDVVVLRNTVNDTTADAMWYSIETSDVTTDDFNISANQSKDVNGKVKRINQLGDMVCSFGSTSGRSCGEVTDLFFDPMTCGPSQNDPCSLSWSLAEGPAIGTCGGDSGGPVFRSRKAYGIVTHGGETCFTFDAFLYMPIDYVELKLNVTLLTN